MKTSGLDAHYSLALPVHASMESAGLGDHSGLWHLNSVFLVVAHCPGDTERREYLLQSSMLLRLAETSEDHLVQLSPCPSKDD